MYGILQTNTETGERAMLAHIYPTYKKTLEAIEFVNGLWFIRDGNQSVMHFEVFELLVIECPEIECPDEYET